eukprot:scaffold138953_cov15-Prasinocladus_malaysianus.AAC.1
MTPLAENTLVAGKVVPLALGVNGKALMKVLQLHHGHAAAEGVPCARRLLLASIRYTNRISKAPAIKYSG